MWQIWSHLPKKFLMENFIFYAVTTTLIISQKMKFSFRIHHFVALLPSNIDNMIFGFI